MMATAFLTELFPQLLFLLFLLPLLKTLLASLCVRLTSLFVEGEVLQNEVLPGYHDFRKAPRDDGKDVWLRFLDNHKQIPGKKERVVVSFNGSDFEQFV